MAFGEVWKDSLTELSGGQRSLLALSLILAMLLFKPAPIYILDEVLLGCVKGMRAVAYTVGGADAQVPPAQPGACTVCTPRFCCTKGPSAQLRRLPVVHMHASHALC